VAGLKDVIHFEGSTARELTRAFRESIDSYLALCAETGQKPDRPFNGKILVRTEPELHRKAALRAAVEGGRTGGPHIPVSGTVPRSSRPYRDERVFGQGRDGITIAPCRTA
jgi:HicB-like protein involved in pilus formation